jgi:hypothetical protein
LAEKPVDLPDIVCSLEQICREGIAAHMEDGPFSDPRLARHVLRRSLDCSLVQVVMRVSAEQDHLLRILEIVRQKAIEVDSAGGLASAGVLSVPEDFSSSRGEDLIHEGGDESALYVIYTQADARCRRKIESDQCHGIERIGHVLVEGVGAGHRSIAPSSRR